MASNPRPMNVIEKIICHHVIGATKPWVEVGEAVCVKVDWTMANELTLVGINDMYTKIGRPGVANKERVWLAVDHTVDPRNYSEPKPSALIKLAEDFSAETGITDFWRPNTTIMHTEFARQRAQPGQIVIGADSHTCSAGGMGALAIGLGAGDVVLPLVTGQTWLTVPEVLRIDFVGAPRFGVGGKDIILHVLGALKRNTVAMERAVEWGGPGMAHLSADARFAIANMSTEFGGIAGVCVADEVTARVLTSRTSHNSEGLYFAADEGAGYAARFTIDLSEVVPQVALFPSPDNCRPVAELAAEGMAIHGAFIGACTTTQEDLILAALVLEAAMASGKTPAPIASANARRVTPGSLAIIEYLRSHGLLEIYERAGFVVGAPGCSYCLGIAADVAGEGEVWLSSQNRNFKNRMGKGSIANLASAVVVAASAFDMKVTDPSPFLAAVDQARYDSLRQWIPRPGGCHGNTATSSSSDAPLFTITEPQPTLITPTSGSGSGSPSPSSIGETDAALSDPATWSHLPDRVSGRVQRFGEGVDTDAIIPAQFMGCSPADMVRYGGSADMSEDAFLGIKCFAYVRPEFVSRVREEGRTVVVAGAGFGCGSSREEAVRSLKAAGVAAVIAPSFAFIYGRNQPNMSLPGVIVSDPEFYAKAGEGASVEVDFAARVVRVLEPVAAAADGTSAAAASAASAAGVTTYPFSLSTMEERFLRAGGVEKLYKTFRKELFKALVAGPKLAPSPLAGGAGGCGGGDCGSAVGQAVADSKMSW